MKTHSTAIVLCVALGAFLLYPDLIAAEARTEPVADAAGNLHVPSNYRTNYQFLGSWSVAQDQGAGAKEMHIVYASPGTAEAYRKSGKFPEGAVLVKEVYGAETAPMTTGTVSHVQTLKGWFVLIKATKNPHPDNKLWGDGWAWSWFDADKPQKTTSTDYHTDCLTCHVPAKDTDWIYIQGYPLFKH